MSTNYFIQFSFWPCQEQKETDSVKVLPKENKQYYFFIHAILISGHVDWSFERKNDDESHAIYALIFWGFLFFSPKSSIQNLFQDITGPFALWEPFLWHLKCYLGLQMFQDLLKQLYVFEFNTSEKTIVSTWISLSRTKQTFWWEHYSYTLQLRCTRHCQCCSIALHVLCMLSNCSPNKSEACSEVNACQALYAAFLFRGWESFQRPKTARMWPNFASRSQKSGPERSG